MSQHQQQTLTGDVADEDQLRGPTTPTLPDVYVLYCPTCDKLVLRTGRPTHPHRLYKPSAAVDKSSQPDDDESCEDDEPEQVGNWYDIELSYSVTYRFRVPAWDEHHAEELAKDWQLDARPGDSHHTHTRRTERGEITTADVPDDYDPYGSEPLHEALERISDAGNKEGER